MDVEVRKITPKELEDLGIKQWPVWEKEVSSFDWHYDSAETCYFLEGDVDVELPSGEKVSLGAGDLAVFPEGLSCRWNIKKKVKKHYSFK